MVVAVIGDLHQANGAFVTHRWFPLIAQGGMVSVRFVRVRWLTHRRSLK